MSRNLGSHLNSGARPEILHRRNWEVAGQNGELAPVGGRGETMTVRLHPGSENSSNRVDSRPVADRKLIKTEAFIVAYAMARLGQPLLLKMGWQSWTDAFAKVGARLGEKHNSIKLLRDEFDVFFPNGRRGWLLREPHPSRLAILHEFSTVSDAALVEFVKHILAGDQATVEEVVDLVSEPWQTSRRALPACERENHWSSAPSNRGHAPSRLWVRLRVSFLFMHAFVNRSPAEGSR